MSGDEIPSVSIHDGEKGGERVISSTSHTPSDGTASEGAGGSSSQGSSEHGDSFDQRSSKSGSTNTTSTSVDSGGSTTSWFAKTQDLLFTVWDLTRAKKINRWLELLLFLVFSLQCIVLPLDEQFGWALNSHGDQSVVINWIVKVLQYIRSPPMTFYWLFPSYFCHCVTLLG